MSTLALEQRHLRCRWINLWQQMFFFEFVTQWKERRSNVHFSIITQNDLSEKNCTCTVSTERKQGEKISFVWPNPRHRGRSGDQVKEKESWQWEWSECRKEARLCACSSASYVSVFVKHALVQLSFRAICAFMAYAKKTCIYKKNSAINVIIVAPEGFLPSTWIKGASYLHERLYHLLLQKLCCSVTHTEYDKWMYTHKLLSFKRSELVIFFKEVSYKVS